MRSEVWASSEQSFAAGLWDQAISAAFRDLEAAIQQRAASSQIGSPLCEAAFDPQVGGALIDLSTDSRDRRSLQHLFAGAIGLYKGSRSHGHAPQVPCPSRDACIRVLSLVSALYDILDLDRNIAPAIIGVNAGPDGSLEIFGERVTTTTCVLIDGVAVPLMSRAGQVLRVRVDPELKPPFKLTLRDGHRHSREFRQDALPLPTTDDNFHQVAETELTVWADQSQSTLLPIKAVAISSREGMRSFVRFFPSGHLYQAGDYVTWDWDMSKILGEAWIRRGGKLVLAWSSSAFFDGRVVANVAAPHLLRIEIRPERIRLAPDAMTPVRVITFTQDGPAVWREDKTGVAALTVADQDIAEVDSGRIIGKRMGTTSLRAVIGTHVTEATIDVAPVIIGEPVPFLGGWKEVRRLARASTSILFTTGDDAIWALGDDCSVTEVLRLAVPESSPLGIDILAVGPKDELYLRSLWDGRVLRLRPDDGYKAADVFAEPHKGASYVSGAFSPRGEFILGLTDGSLVRSDLDSGASETLLRLPSVPAGMAWRGDEMYVVSAGNRPGYYRLSPPMQNAEWFAGPPGALGSPSAVVCVGDDILIADFYGGVVVAVGEDDSVKVVARGFTNPTSLAVGQYGRLFVSDLSTDVVSVVHL